MEEAQDLLQPLQDELDELVGLQEDVAEAAASAQRRLAKARKKMGKALQRRGTAQPKGKKLKYKALRKVLRRELEVSTAVLGSKPQSDDAATSESTHVGKVLWVPMSKVRPAQVRYSRLNVANKAQKVLAGGGAIWSSRKGWIPGFFSGRSCFPAEEALPAVRAHNGYVLADGHHHALGALSLGASFVPIKVIEDLSYMDEEQLWRAVDDRKLSHLYDLGANRVEAPKSLHDLVNDSNRFLAGVTARKFGGASAKDAAKSKGPEYPVWIKVGKSIPFIEFHISDALRDAGFEYKDSWGALHIPTEVVERMRHILVRARVPGLTVVKRRIHWDEWDDIDPDEDFLSTPFPLQDQ